MPDPIRTRLLLAVMAATLAACVPVALTGHPSRTEIEPHCLPDSHVTTGHVEWCWVPGEILYPETGPTP